LLLEGAEVAGREHSVDLLLVLFEQFEVLLLEFEHLNIAALVDIELELNVLPDFLKLGKGLFHLGLLSSLVGDLLNVLLVLVQV
jgi:hypothetical protein